jgi:hypothetical protein
MAGGAFRHGRDSTACPGLPLLCGILHGDETRPEENACGQIGFASAALLARHTASAI